MKPFPAPLKLRVHLAATCSHTSALRGAMKHVMETRTYARRYGTKQAGLVERRCKTLRRQAHAVKPDSWLANSSNEKHNRGSVWRTARCKCEPTRGPPGGTTAVRTQKRTRAGAQLLTRPDKLFRPCTARKAQTQAKTLRDVQKVFNSVAKHSSNRNVLGTYAPHASTLGGTQLQETTHDAPPPEPNSRTNPTRAQRCSHPSQLLADHVSPTATPAKGSSPCNSSPESLVPHGRDRGNAAQWLLQTRHTLGTQPWLLLL